MQAVVRSILPASEGNDLQITFQAFYGKESVQSKVRKHGPAVRYGYNVNVFKKFVCLFLALILTFSMVPLSVFAAEETPTGDLVDGDVYTISNDYIRYSINAKTGGFSVETLDGNPQKYLDDNIPLLYREDADRCLAHQEYKAHP